MEASQAYLRPKEDSERMAYIELNPWNGRDSREIAKELENSGLVSEVYLLSGGHILVKTFESKLLEIEKYGTIVATHTIIRFED